MPDANVENTVDHYKLSMNYMRLGMASKSQISAKLDTDTALTLLLFYNFCNTVTGRGLDCFVVPVLQRSHLLVYTRHIFANSQMKICLNGYLWLLKLYCLLSFLLYISERLFTTFANFSVVSLSATEQLPCSTLVVTALPGELATEK